MNKPIITKKQIIEGIVMLLIFPVYVMAFRKALKSSGLDKDSKSFYIRYFVRVIHYGIPSALTWFTRKLIVNQYDEYSKYIV
jgi:hypothetical protein